MPGISQSESLSPALPIENSPPGIQTIPGGAGDRGDVAFVTVDAKEEDTSGTRVGDDASVDWRGDVGRSAYTVNDAAMTKPSISSQPAYDRRTSGDFFLRFIRHLSKAKTRLQSFFILTTIQQCFIASSCSALSNVSQGRSAKRSPPQFSRTTHSVGRCPL
jgi:hypothetical protein